MRSLHSDGGAKAKASVFALVLPARHTADPSAIENNGTQPHNTDMAWVKRRPNCFELNQNVPQDVNASAKKLDSILAEVKEEGRYEEATVTNSVSTMIEMMFQRKARKKRLNGLFFETQSSHNLDHRPEKDPVEPPMRMN